MTMPRLLFYVTVSHGGEVVHERAFKHEMAAREWGDSFGDGFIVSMGRYAPSPWPTRKRSAKDSKNS